MLTDGIYELYRPVKPKVEILFFHGLQVGDYRTAYMTTWMSASNTECWPGTWLVEEIPDARVLLISYDSSAAQTAEQGRLDLFATGENLLASIVDLAKVGQDHGCPVVLIGHSLGGLVIKEVCIQAHRVSSHVTGMPGNLVLTERRRKFLNRLEGMFFYSTPHSGSMLATVATNLLSGPLLKDLTVLNYETARLNQEFSRCRAMYNWRLSGVGEAHEMTLGPCHGVVVSEASARQGMDNFMMVAADHMSICKPKDKTSSAFDFLMNFIGDILIEEKRVLAKRLQLWGLPEHAVGLQTSARAVQSKLQGAQRVGLVGIAGSGKTTLAKTVFNNICASFEYTCFLEDVKEHWKQPIRLLKVQELIHANLYHFGRRATNIPPGDEMWEIIKGKAFLLVLDDINFRAQISTLPNLDIFAETSRVVVTTRNKGLLDGFLCHDVDGLGELDSEKLFCSHAFEGQEVLPAAFKEVGLQVLQKCSGLPLTLEVMGTFLRHQRDLDIWRQALVKLERAEDLDGSAEGRENYVLWDKLKISITSLGEEEKEMFLDIATHLYGLPLYLVKATSMSNAPDICFNNLVNRCLVQVRESQLNYSWEFVSFPIPVVGMHEQLRDLGRNIARNGSGKKRHSSLELYTRIWEEDKARELLQSNQGIPSETTALELDGMMFKEGEKIPTSSLSRFKKLRHLTLSNVPFQGSFDKHFPIHLGLLRWCDTKLHQLPIKASQLQSLKVLALLQCDVLEALPEPFELLTQLQVLILECPLRQLPARLGNLTLLQRLQFNSSSITVLPDSFGELQWLRHLVLFCSKLQSLPENFGRLCRLQVFILQSSELRALPESFGLLYDLEVLTIVCEKVEVLPNSFGLLTSLKTLHFEGCPIESLPETFGKLSSLQTLQFDIAFEGHKLTLPESFGQLSSLEELNLDFVALNNVPNSFGQLLELKDLTFMTDGMSGEALWTMAETLQEVESLEQMNYQYIDKLLSWDMLGNPRGSHDNRPRIGSRILYDLMSNCFSYFFDTKQKVRSERLEILEEKFQTAALEHELRTSFLERLDELGWDCTSIDNKTVLLSFEGVKISGKKAKIQRHSKLGGNQLPTEEGLKWQYMKNYHTGQSGAALENLNKLVKDHMVHQYYWQERGVLKRVEFNDLEGALADLDKSLDLLPDKYECLKHRAYVRHLMGDKVGARADAEHAMVVMPPRARELQPSPHGAAYLGALPVTFSIYNLP